jgi:hypothetical protein
MSIDSGEDEIKEEMLYSLLEAIFPEDDERWGKRGTDEFSLDLPEDTVAELIELGFIEKEDEAQDIMSFQNCYNITPKGIRFLECIDKMNHLLSNSGGPK